MSLQSCLCVLVLFSSLSMRNCYLLSNNQMCPFEALVELGQDNNFHGESSVTLDGIAFSTDSIQRKNNKSYICPCEKTLCLPYCCFSNHCNETNETLTLPPIYDRDTLEKVNDSGKVLNFYKFFWDPCHGKGMYQLEPKNFKQDEFKLVNNGSILLTNKHLTKNFTDYCLGFIYADDTEYSVFTCFSNDATELGIDSSDSDAKRLHIMLVISMVISVPCFIGVFLIYSCLPELNHFHGRTLRSYVACLTVCYIILPFINFVPDKNISDEICELCAYIVYFSFMASFFWLNVMCFDIWWTFCGPRSRQGNDNQGDNKKFFIYSTYAWSASGILTIICFVFDHLEDLSNLVRPEFGEGSCWFRSRKAKTIYFYGPMGLTVICNIMLFILTTVKINQHKRETNVYLKCTNRRQDDNKRWFHLYLRLFIVMGITWSMEIFSWMFAKNFPSYVWYFTDLTNTLQGVIIFKIFVCKKRIKHLLRKRFNWLNKKPILRNTTHSVEYHSNQITRCG